MATVNEIKNKSKQQKDTFIDTSKLEKLTDPNGIKLTETEIRLLTELNRKKDLVSREVSFLAQQRLTIDFRQQEAEKLYRDNLELEKQLGNQLTEKYGNGAIDIDQGIFIPA